MSNLNYDTNELIYKTETNSNKECQFMVPKGKRGGINWECGMSRYTLLHIKRMNNKVLLYSTGNYIQYAIISHNGQGMKKNMCVYI